jgi:chromosome segregation ATPase
MSEQNDRSKQLEDARTLARITTAWREAEEALAGMEEKVREARNQTDYWLNEYHRQNRKIAELEARIKELESPLAELARSLNDNTNDRSTK